MKKIICDKCAKELKAEKGDLCSLVFYHYNFLPDRNDPIGQVDLCHSCMNQVLREVKGNVYTGDLA